MKIREISMKITRQYKKTIIEAFGDDAGIVFKAYAFAEKKHRGQKRDGGSPYILHPVRVAEYVRTFKKSKNAVTLYVAALLHDTIEDTYTSYKEITDNFGEMVSSIVMELSTAKFAPLCMEGGKAEYLSKKMENMTNYALVIKLCDRLDNLMGLMECTKEKRDRIVSDTKIILAHLKTKRRFTASQKKVVDAIMKQLKELAKQDK